MVQPSEPYDVFRKDYILNEPFRYVMVTNTRKIQCFKQSRQISFFTTSFIKTSLCDSASYSSYMYI